MIPLVIGIVLIVFRGELAKALALFYVRILHLPKSFMEQPTVRAIQKMCLAAGILAAIIGLLVFFGQPWPVGIRGL